MSASSQVVASGNAAGITGGASGIPAVDVADLVVAAVDAEQFWILTHEDMRARPAERMERAATQTNPPLLGED